MKKFKEIIIEANEDTAKFFKIITTKKNPLFVEGGICQGKSTLLKVVAEIFIAKKVKLLGLSDSVERELFEFISCYPTVWFRPNHFRGVYKSTHRNLQIEYIDVFDLERMYSIISRAKERVFICDDFLPLVFNDFSKKHFPDFHPDFPEVVLFFFELSTALNNRNWQKPGNKESGSVLRQIRHIGENGFFFVADMQNVKQIDKSLRELAGINFVFKNEILRNDTPQHTHLKEICPGIERTIARLTPKEFVAFIDNREILFCGNTRPAFQILAHKNQTSKSYYKITGVTYQEMNTLEDSFLRDIRSILNPEEASKTKSFEEWFEVSRMKIIKLKTEDEKIEE